MKGGAEENPAVELAHVCIRQTAGDRHSVGEVAGVKKAHHQVLLGTEVTQHSSHTRGLRANLPLTLAGCVSLANSLTSPCTF